MWLKSFNYFRGLAILSVVAGHSFRLSGWKINAIGEKFIANLVIGGAGLFVFISGFLFHHVYCKNYNYAKFMKKKVRNIFSPYLVLTAPYIIYCVFIKDWGTYQHLFIEHDNGIYYSHIKPIMLFVATGSSAGSLYSFWFIPFIMSIFIISPLLMWYVRMSPMARAAIFLCSFALALFVQCPVGNLSVPQWVLYYLPMFLLGIMISIHREAFYRVFKGKELFLLLAVVLCAYLQARYYPGFGSLHKPLLQAAWPDVHLVQKIFLSLLLMVFLHRYEESNFSILDTVGATSFAIYFLHFFVLYGIDRFFSLGYFPWERVAGPVLWLLVTLVATLICIGLAKVVHAVFGNRSRMLIGY